jgi:hypothetical protein
MDDPVNSLNMTIPGRDFRYIHSAIISGSLRLPFATPPI